VSRVRENRMPGSMRRREESGTSRARTRRTVLAPPADPTLTRCLRPRRADPRRGRVRPRAHTFSRLAVIATTKASTARAPSQPYGPYYSWTRKVHNKTVTRLRSAQQAERCRPWLENDRRLRQLTPSSKRSPSKPPQTPEGGGEIAAQRCGKTAGTSQEPVFLFAQPAPDRLAALSRDERRRGCTPAFPATEERPKARVTRAASGLSSEEERLAPEEGRIQVPGFGSLSEPQRPKA
jgi:hypothetical protein